jgi:hypothetical protein
MTRSSAVFERIGKTRVSTAIRSFAIETVTGAQSSHNLLKSKSPVLFGQDGAFFGESALVGAGAGQRGARRLRTVTAVSDCDLCYLTEKRFRKLEAEHPEISVKLHKFAKLRKKKDAHVINRQSPKPGGGGGDGGGGGGFGGNPRTGMHLHAQNAADAEADAGHTLKSGWMEKKGKKRTNWTRRFFVLTPSELLYYDSDSFDKKKMGAIDVSTATRVDHSQCADAAAHEIEVHTANRSFRLVPADLEEAHKWVVAIANAMHGGAQSEMGHFLPTSNSSKRMASTFQSDVGGALGRIFSSGTGESSPDGGEDDSPSSRQSARPPARRLRARTDQTGESQKWIGDGSPGSPPPIPVGRVAAGTRAVGTETREGETKELLFELEQVRGQPSAAAVAAAAAAADVRHPLWLGTMASAPGTKHLHSHSVQG